MPEFKAKPIAVLLLEDDTDIRDLLTEVLETEGYEVTGAPRAAAALELLRTAPFPSLILVDLTLPDMPGADLLRRMNDLPARSQAKVLICSGQDNLAEKARELRADGFIRKPYNLDEFLQQIAAVLQ